MIVPLLSSFFSLAFSFCMMWQEAHRLLLKGNDMRLNLDIPAQELYDKWASFVILLCLNFLVHRIRMINPPHKVIFFKKRFYLFILERGEESGEERERNINVQEKHQSVASCTPPSGDLVCNPGMCHDWELNQQPFGFQAGAQSTQPCQPGHAVIFLILKEIM